MFWLILDFGPEEGAECRIWKSGEVAGPLEWRSGMDGWIDQDKVVNMLLPEVAAFPSHVVLVTPEAFKLPGVQALISAREKMGPIFDPAKSAPPPEFWKAALSDPLRWKLVAPARFLGVWVLEPHNDTDLVLVGVSVDG